MQELNLKKGDMYISLLLTEAKRSDGRVEREGKAGHGERNRKENDRNKNVEKAGKKTYHSQAVPQEECYKTKNLILGYSGEILSFSTTVRRGIYIFPPQAVSM